jgi:hypothetical protein
VKFYLAASYARRREMQGIAAALPPTIPGAAP